jgi:hypothetical protein
MSNPKRDYCSHSPDTVDGIDIGWCCKHHDNDVGQAGTYNPITPHISFYKCLKKTGLKTKYVVAYTIGGAFFSLIKYPYLSYTRYKYRKNK